MLEFVNPAVLSASPAKMTLWSWLRIDVEAILNDRSEAIIQERLARELDAVAKQPDSLSMQVDMPGAGPCVFVTTDPRTIYTFSLCARAALNHEDAAFYAAFRAGEDEIIDPDVRRIVGATMMPWAMSSKASELTYTQMVKPSKLDGPFQADPRRVKVEQ